MLYHACMEEKETLLEFPCDFPIKAMGRSNSGFEAAALEIVRRHVSDFPIESMRSKASREGKVAAEVIAGKPAAFDNVAIPAVVFTDPEIAWAGLTEEEAKAAGRKIKVGRFPLAALGRAAHASRRALGLG